MRRKSIQAQSDYDYCVKYASLLNAIGDLGLTPMEIKAMAGFFLIALSNPSSNVLSTRNQAKITVATGIQPSNLRSLTKRLIGKNLIRKVDRAEGYVPEAFAPKQYEQFQILLERVSQEGLSRAKDSFS